MNVVTKKSYQIFQLKNVHYLFVLKMLRCFKLNMKDVERIN